MTKNFITMNKNSQLLKDTFNRKIDYLRISITDRCNLKCLYCTPKKALKHFSASEILTDNEIIRFVQIAHRHGLSKVRITGGEPLVRKNIIGLVSSIRHIGIRDLSLTTNGLMLSSLAEKLKDAGLTRVNISLDTLDADKYKRITRGGDIALVWKAIRAAEKAGLTPVKINAVPIKGINDDEIESFAALTLENNFHIRFIEFMPAVGDGTWARNKYIKSARILEKISAIGELEPFNFRGTGPSRNFRIKGARGVIGIISPLSDHFCAHCNRLRLTANGRLRPCLFSNETIDIKTPLRNGISDEQLEMLFLQSIKAKPQGHGLKEKQLRTSPINSMSEIGG